MKWGEKKPEREKKEGEECSGRNVGPGLNGRELGAKIYGAELSAIAMPSTEPRSSTPGTLAPS